MDDLVRWLRSVLDTEAEEARAAAEQTEPDWYDNGEAVYSSPHGTPVAVGPWTGYLMDEVRAHVVRHDPAHVLRANEAKRRSVDRATAVLERGWDYYENSTVIDLAAGTLRDIASAYSDQPGYREEWAP